MNRLIACIFQILVQCRVSLTHVQIFDEEKLLEKKLKKRLKVWKLGRTTSFYQILFFFRAAQAELHLLPKDQVTCLNHYRHIAQLAHEKIYQSRKWSFFYTDELIELIIYSALVQRYASKQLLQEL